MIRRLGFAALLGLTLLSFGPVQARGGSPVLDDEAQDVSIAMLTSINYREGKPLPDEVTELDGLTVRLEGYMALGTLEGLEKFEFMAQACECGRSKVQHFIEVTIEEGLTTYRPGRIILEGVLSVGEVEEDGFVVSIYRLTIKSLDPDD